MLTIEADTRKRKRSIMAGSGLDADTDERPRKRTGSVMTPKDEYAIDVTRVFTFYNVGDVQPGIEAARRFVVLQTDRFGREHPETALAQGALAVGLSRVGRDDEALKLFRAAAPRLPRPPGDSLLRAWP